jgi:hypothetical protein
VWEIWDDLGCGATAAINFTNGEANGPPIGTGGFQVITDLAAQGGGLATAAYDGNLVGALSALRISGRSNDVSDHPYIYIKLQSGDVIYFAPVYQAAAQGSTAVDLWQSWDALNGLWTRNGDPGDNGLQPLSAYAAEVITGIRLAAGCSVDGANHIRAIDDFEIGVAGSNPTVYDFERN